MFWETVAASFFLLVTSPFWILAAVFWGLLKAAITILLTSLVFFQATPIQWDQIWPIPVSAIIEGLQAAWSIPSSMWGWAKFEHPWWAAGITFLLAAAGGGR